MRKYVVGAVADVGGGAHPLLSVDATPYDLRDAIEVCREKDERHRRIWPDTNVSHHVYRLEQVSAYIEHADLSPGPERTPEKRAAFDAYLASSEALEGEECTCGHLGNWHLHGPETWGECDAEGCGCAMYRTTVDAAWWHQ